MSDIAIKVDNLSKVYRIGVREQQHDTLAATIASWFKTPFKNFQKLKSLSKFNTNGEDEQDMFWALKNISFELCKGDVLGIVGKNGAGKSTLLKILSRISEPTNGRIEIYGRVASLLEVGTGFNPELTGRENVYLNGTILGMTKKEIDAKFDEIVSFSGIEKFIDTPVKRYSSGMKVRLAFAVAAHLEPEILIIDEVLAVGDAEFQKKCLGKMQDVAGLGRTVLFVSHNMAAVQTLCNKTIVLKGGELKFNGGVAEGIHFYLNEFSRTTVSVEYTKENAPGNDIAALLKAEVKPLADKNWPIQMGDAFEIHFEFWYKSQVEKNLDITFHLLDEMSNLVFVGTTGTTFNKKFSSGTVTAICRVPAHVMHEGSYNISRLLLVMDRGRLALEVKDVLFFDIVNPGSDALGRMEKKEGIIRPNLEWTF